MSSSVTLGIHIVDILVYPVEQIPSGQTLAFVEQVRTTVAGSAAVLDAPEGRRDDFVDPYFKQAKTDEVVVFSKPGNRPES